MYVDVDHGPMTRWLKKNREKVEEDNDRNKKRDRERDWER